MKRGLKLRRFKSEVNIEEKSENKDVNLSLEPRVDAIELLQNSLSHAVSQPDIFARIRQGSPKVLRFRQNGIYII